MLAHSFPKDLAYYIQKEFQRLVHLNKQTSPLYEYRFTKLKYLKLADH